MTYDLMVPVVGPRGRKSRVSLDFSYVEALLEYYGGLLFLLTWGGGNKVANEDLSALTVAKIDLGIDLDADEVSREVLERFGKIMAANVSPDIEIKVLENMVGAREKVEKFEREKEICCDIVCQVRLHVVRRFPNWLTKVAMGYYKAALAQLA